MLTKRMSRAMKSLEHPGHPRPPHHDGGSRIDPLHRGDFETLMPGCGVPECMHADFEVLMRARFERAMPGCITDNMRAWVLWKPRLDRGPWQFTARIQWTLDTYAMEIDASVRWLVEHRALLDRYAVWTAICTAARDGIDLHLLMAPRAKVQIALVPPPLRFEFEETGTFVQIGACPEGWTIDDELIDETGPGVVIVRGDLATSIGSIPRTNRDAPSSEES